MTLELILLGVVRRRGAGVIRDGLWGSGEAATVIFIIGRTRARSVAFLALAHRPTHLMCSKVGNQGH